MKKPIMDFPVQKIVDYVNARETLPFVLLGVGPMSPLVIRTAIEVARDTRSPAMIIASRNQVETEELGGGYVTSTSGFVKHILTLSQEAAFDGLLYICRDHGGPWQRNDEKEMPSEEAWERALQSYSSDIEAGFNFLHIDPTLSRKGRSAPDMKKIISDTIRLIEHCEKEAAGRQLNYEVGTEEISGRAIRPADFEEFIKLLLSELDKRGLARPCFIVGQTGTLIKMDRNIGTVYPAAASELTGIARRYGLGFKEHNADYLPDFILEHHRKWGITAANVAPMCGVAETKACLQLADMLIGGGIAKGKASGFYEVIKSKVIASNRWKKWLYPDSTELDAEKINQSPSLTRHIVEVNGHYVFGERDVSEARQKMVSNLKEVGMLDTSPEKIISDSIKAGMMRYIEPFKLAGSTPKILKGAK